MLISIVLPVRNAAAALPAALASVRAQTHSHWELLAIDDGSTDDTPNLLAAARAADPRVRVVRQPALGIVEALQRACAAARGPLIARFDADDVMAPERLEKQLRFLAQHPEIGLVSCLVRHGGDPGAQAGYAAHIDWINSLTTPQDMALRRFVEAPVAHPSVLFRCELLDRHGGYAQGDFPEDYELWLRWLEAGVQFGKVPEALLTWNDPPGRLSRTDPRYRPEAFYRLKMAHLARWLRRALAPGRQVWLWGAGRVTRGRFAALEEEGIPIAGFIDVDRKKHGRQRDGRPVVGLDRLPASEKAFIITGVAKRGARQFITDQLHSGARVEGRDYLLAA